jgi:hypothetical protein
VEALLQILFQAVRDNLFQPSGNLFSCREQFSGLSFQNRRHGLRGGLPRERAPPCDHFSTQPSEKMSLRPCKSYLGKTNLLEVSPQLNPDVNQSH